jgi:uncharacterized protein (DUF952 family)
MLFLPSDCGGLVRGSVRQGIADLQNRGQLDQLRFVFVGVVLAEQQLTPGRQLGPYASSGTAAIAAVSPGQFPAGKRCVHGVLRSRGLRLVWPVARFSTLTDTFRIGLVPKAPTGVSCLTFCIARGGRTVTRVSVLLHICAAPDWVNAQRRGEHRPDSLRDAGFVHLSTPQQVHLPANRLYAGRTDLLLLHIDTSRLEAPVRWERGDATDPASMLFPHLYGPLPVSAVIAVTEYRPGGDGRFVRVQPSGA